MTTTTTLSNRTASITVNGIEYVRYERTTAPSCPCCGEPTTTMAPRPAFADQADEDAANLCGRCEGAAELEYAEAEADRHFDSALRA